jgi:hypothetical protein
MIRGPLCDKYLEAKSSAEDAELQATAYLTSKWAFVDQVRGERRTSERLEGPS